MLLRERGGKFAPRRGRSLPESAFHDFSQYLFLTPPLTGAESAPRSAPVGELHWWLPFVEDIKATIAHFVRTRIPNTIPDPWSAETIVRANTRWNNEDLTALLLSAFRQSAAVPLYELYRSPAFARSGLCFADVANLVETILEEALEARRSASAGSWGMAYAAFLRDFDYVADESWKMLADVLLDRLRYAMARPGDVPSGAARGGPTGGAQPGYDAPAGGRDDPPGAPLHPLRYPFDPYLSGSVNLGLRLVYRQSWRPLGTQAGEIVRTLPLGPKQSVRVSSKATRRSKRTRQSETTHARESSREASDTTKDSSEIVHEAAEKFNWHAEASASASFGLFGGDLSTGVGGETASSSKATKARINEAMEKTASKIRTETKVSVSVEGESTFEESSSSEITNPNDEIAVTYVYSRLQRQYEISTKLAEVASVVFVAEPLPRPEEIDAHWIRRHDWILSRVLLDESFAEDLAVVRAPPPTMESDIDEKVTSLMDAISGAEHLLRLASSPGTLPDFMKAPQEIYERELERKRARDAAHAEREARLERLRVHLVDNILHYCRAIWTAEDPERRTLRFSRLQAPVEWKFVVDAGPGADDLVPGRWIATKTRPVAELIDAAGPLGFAGNYAIYALRSSALADVATLPLRALRSAYQRIVVQTSPANVRGGAVVTEALAWQPQRLRQEYRIEYRDGQLVVSRDDDLLPRGPGARPGTTSVDRDSRGRTRVQRRRVTVARERYEPGRPLRFEGIKITLDEDPGHGRGMREGDTWLVLAEPTPGLQDPDYARTAWETSPPTRAREADVFDSVLLEDMADHLSEIEAALLDEEAADWSKLSAQTRERIRARYTPYVFARENTRRFILETNNLMLDLDTGQTPILEDFKRLHRYLDVLKALAENERSRLENKRRALLIGDKRYGDPEIERVTLVTKDAKDLVVVPGDEGA